MSLYHLFVNPRLLLASLSTVLLGASDAVAQTAVSLPVGALVNLSSTGCGQIKGDWIPGTIDGRGRFISLPAQITALRRRLARANRSQRPAIQRQLNSANRQLTTRTPVCDQLETGVTAPRSAQAALFAPIAWNTDMFSVKQSLGSTLGAGDVGSVWSFFCPPNFAVDSVWGVDTYTADTSICNAAVHAGVITRQFGGNVQLRVKNGLDYYVGSIRNGISSFFYSSYPWSYSFLNGPSEVGSSAPAVIEWSTRMTQFRSRIGQEFVFLCPANGRTGSLWGTGTYTDDSTVCTAAVHAGRISARKGGLIRVVMAPGQSSYLGSSRNRITSSSYERRWEGSYFFR